MKILLLLQILIGVRLSAQDIVTEGTKPGQSRVDNGIQMTLHWCPPGSFIMGSPANEPGRDAYETSHNVTLTQGFWIGETEVTQAQWLAVTNLSLFAQAQKMLDDPALYPVNGKQLTLRQASNAGDGADAIFKVCAATAPNIPIYYVSWDDAVMFCSYLTMTERAAGRLPAGWVYALPTEAQWEYACRAGTATATYAGEMRVLGENNAPVLNAIAWYGGNNGVGYKGAGWTTENWPNQAFPAKRAGPRRVGQKKPNAWGLKDTLGNLYEWVADYSAVYSEEDAVDPTGPTEGVNHPYRGGAWKHYATMSRAAKSFEAPPAYRVNDLGFRVVLVREVAP